MRKKSFQRSRSWERAKGGTFAELAKRTGHTTGYLSQIARELDLEMVTPDEARKYSSCPEKHSLIEMKTGTI
jgi:hypothetical protein